MRANFALRIERILANFCLFLPKSASVSKMVQFFFGRFCQKADLTSGQNIPNPKKQIAYSKIDESPLSQCFIIGVGFQQPFDLISYLKAQEIQLKLKSIIIETKR